MIFTLRHRMAVIENRLQALEFQVSALTHHAERELEAANLASIPPATQAKPATAPGDGRREGWQVVRRRLEANSQE